MDDSSGKGAKHPAPLAALTQVVFDLLRIVESTLDEGPCPERVALRDCRFKLVRAFPRQFAVSEVELAQQLAEEDGEALDETL